MNRFIIKVTSICLIVWFNALTAMAASGNTAPLILEVTGPVGKALNEQPVLKFCKLHHIDAASVYRWQNHLVIYNVPKKLSKVQKQLQAVYPHAHISAYITPFYHFDRSRHCKGAAIAKQWTNILLTANLVRNTRLQQEYLHYHATQFQKWPEVSRGFCNADFQQLLVYKNGRQLMLVISIPKGKTLDELNPKTTENNPRVDQWNAMMKKYQEGLPGTKPGEVWVFLQPVKTK